MSAILRFYTAHLEMLFQVIGSGDRDLLRQIGVPLGDEFRPPTDDEEDAFFGDEQTEEPDWTLEDEEETVAREIVEKMVMDGMPADLAEDEAYAVQDYMAGYALHSDAAHLIDLDDMPELRDDDDYVALRPEMRRDLVEGIELEQVTDFLEWLKSSDASHELVTRVEMLACGRLPEALEPTFADLEEDLYHARFGYWTSSEAADLEDELDEIAREHHDELGELPVVLSALSTYCNAHNLDLVCIIDE